MTDDIVLEARRNKVGHLTMNRPGARNSLSMAMLERLHSEIVDLGKAHDVYVIVILGVHARARTHGRVNDNPLRRLLSLR